MVNKLAAILLLALFAAGVLAQGRDYPARPIRVLHGFTPGGPVDIIARLVAAHFSETLGQQAIVDGKPGAGGTVGAAYVAKAEPDGYTLFLMASGHATSAALHKSLPYDTAGDFTMVSMLASSPFAIMTLPNAPYANLQDLVQKARAQPGRIDYGSGGIGSGMHLVAVLLQARTGMQLNHIPYKGGSSPMQALLAGEVPVLFSSVAGMAPQVEAGKIRMLAVTSKARYGSLPAVPTVAETVAPDFEVLAWYALAGPRRLPAAIVAKLNGAAHAALKRADISARISGLGAMSWPTTPREAQEFLASEVTRWTKVIRDERIEAQ